MRPLRICGGRALVDGELRPVDLLIADGRIAGLDESATGSHLLNARGLLVLPGIVDIHGDAFERQLQPRPGIAFPTALALEDTERQLLANGITTAFHGITLSWEPGLRGIEAWRALLDALGARAWGCDMRAHLRWEAYNLDALDTALADIAAGRVQLLAFNDHTPAILKRLGDPAKAVKYSERAGVDDAAFRAIADRAAARATEVAPAQARLAAAARAAGIPMASHDDDSIATRDGFRAHGARICEFPMEEEIGRAARAAGDFVVMGSPNVVRGKSHLGWASAARLAEAGICNVLSSDYFYPCLLQAPFILAGRRQMGLPAAWELVSASPAAAAGLRDRGVIAPGRRADLVLVAAEAGAPRVVATIAHGRLVYLAPHAWDTLHAVA
jgi:alpha-D-ribose 1-methylphosphonate 5-triphosphate diphosphatase